MYLFIYLYRFGHLNLICILLGYSFTLFKCLVIFLFFVFCYFVFYILANFFNLHSKTGFTLTYSMLYIVICFSCQPLMYMDMFLFIVNFPIFCT